MADTTESVAASKRWFWDSEGQPTHVDCGGEVTFFHTLSDEEAAICLTCCECGLSWQEEVRTDG